jgi:hypothetical protein
MIMELPPYLVARNGCDVGKRCSWGLHSSERNLIQLLQVVWYCLSSVLYKTQLHISLIVEIKAL